MAYSASNPPQLIFRGPGTNGFGLWGYRSADGENAYDDTDYITNAKAIGMRTGDVCIVTDSATPAASIGLVTVDSDGNGTLSALTAISQA